ncbi:hypothetical protein GCM10025859_61010 [Alicyclobacillus fastidiosus]|nr:hypothetical protein GCM10025859_61010 [Alicyclobacillus fastidiosus]
MLTLKSTEDIPWGTYTHHYDAVQITNNSTGQSSWIVGSDESDMSDMQVEDGGNGAQTDSVTVDTSSFANGSYTATLFVRDGVDRVSSEPATTTFTITSNSDIGTGKTIQLSANPTSLNVGQSSTLTATAISIPSTDYIKIVDSSLSNTLPGNQSSYSDGLSGEKSLVTTATYDKVGSVSYVAQEINETTGGIDAQSPPVTVTWTAPAASITLTPSSDTQVQSGTPVTISYKATGMISGEFVVVQAITDNGAKNAWYDSGDKNSSNFDYEVESPVNGASVSVKYVATIYNGSLDRLATAYSGTITWVSQKPTITITASPQTNVPGEPSEIQYSVNTLSPGDTISVVGTGGSHPWNVSNQTNYVEQYQQMKTQPLDKQSRQITRRISMTQVVMW